MEPLKEVEEKAKRTKEAWPLVANLSTNIKNAVLEKAAILLRKNTAAVLEANSKDVEAAKAKGISKALLDRLILNEKRIEDMAKSLEDVAALPDPVGEAVAMWKRPNGLVMAKVRVPIGAVAMIYEARPNVTIEAFSIAFKAGNTILLRGGSEAINSNIALVKILKSALKECDVTEDAVNIIEIPGRETVQYLIKMDKYLDLLIPRGGSGLIQFVTKNATVPSIETGVGNCHVYVDKSADVEMALRIVDNAKTQRPAVCNAAETLLVHSEIAQEFLPKIGRLLVEKGVELRACPKAFEIFSKNGIKAVPATKEDWGTEFLDLILAVKVVNSLDEAIEHINKYGTKHSEAIVTSDYFAAKKFTDNVDAAAVYVNASTRFTDGGQFGLGAEIGISTQKLHARGPMGLRELTTTKYVVWGTGQVRE